jgi:transcription initiation factor TFIIIB Brf1 subunit/transcription initiation factor TFIIB
MSVGKPSYSYSSNTSSAYGHSVMNNLTRTQIGTPMERVKTKFKAMETQQIRSFCTNDVRMHGEALYETKRICECIGLPNKFVDTVMKTFKSLWVKTKKYSMQRNIQNFVPVTIYRTAQRLGYSLPIRQLLPVIQPNAKKFRAVLFGTYHLFGRVDHYKTIIKHIKKICTKLQVSSQLFITAMKIFSRERRELMLSTPNIAASAAVGMAIIALKQRNTIPLMLVAKVAKSSQAAFTSRIFKVAEKRKIRIHTFKVTELDSKLPSYYKKLIASTMNFVSPVIRDTVQNINRIVTEMKMPYKVKKRAIRLLRANRRILLMTTREVCAASAVGLAVLTLGINDKHSLFNIGKVIGCSSSSISSRIFKVVKARGIECYYKISCLKKTLPKKWKDLVGRY